MSKKLSVKEWVFMIVVLAILVLVVISHQKKPTPFPSVGGDVIQAVQ